MASLEKFHPAQALEEITVPQSITYNWEYDSTRKRLSRLYENAKRDQWNASERLDWSIDVDPEKGLLPDPAIGIYGTDVWARLDDGQIQRLRHEMVTWQLCQFLHGEQGALLATAQIVDSVPWYEAKQYGATQVMDEARHVEVYRRFIQEKLGNEYEVNVELKKLLDQILMDSRWDMKFLGMQIMIEGLALGAFSMMYQSTREPLLKELLRYVIQDEARHVHYGVLALKRYFAELTDSELREREDWTFEVACLMRDRFLAHEIHDEWFGSHMKRADWNKVISDSPFLVEFRQIMFKRLVPNLEYIGLFSPRIRAHYEKVGLTRYAGGRNASELTAEDLLTA